MVRKEGDGPASKCKKKKVRKCNKTRSDWCNSSRPPHHMFLTNPNATTIQTNAQCVPYTTRAHHCTTAAGPSKYHSFFQ